MSLELGPTHAIGRDGHRIIGWIGRTRSTAEELHLKYIPPLRALRNYYESDDWVVVSGYMTSSSRYRLEVVNPLRQSRRVRAMFFYSSKGDAVNVYHRLCMVKLEDDATLAASLVLSGAQPTTASLKDTGLPH